MKGKIQNASGEKSSNRISTVVHETRKNKQGLAMFVMTVTNQSKAMEVFPNSKNGRGLKSLICKASLLIVMLLFMSGISGYAQSTNGVVAGLNFTHGGYLGSFVNWANNSDQDHYVKSKTGFQIGFLNDRSFKNPNWGIQWGSSFMQLGFESGYTGRNPWTQKLRVSFIQSRGDFYYKLGSENAALLLQAGLFCNLSLHYKIINDDGTANESAFAFSGSDIGIAFGAACVFQDKYQVGISHNRGMTLNYTMVNFSYFFGN